MQQFSCCFFRRGALPLLNSQVGRAERIDLVSAGAKLDAAKKFANWPKGGANEKLPRPTADRAAVFPPAGPRPRVYSPADGADDRRIHRYCGSWRRKSSFAGDLNQLYPALPAPSLSTALWLAQRCTPDAAPWFKNCVRRLVRVRYEVAATRARALAWTRRVSMMKLPPIVLQKAETAAGVLVLRRRRRRRGGDGQLLADAELATTDEKPEWSRIGQDARR